MLSGHEDYLTIDEIRKALLGAQVGEACDFMMDAGVKILVFENNEKAEAFEKIMKGGLLHE